MIGSQANNLTVVQVWEGGEKVEITLLVIDPLGYIPFDTDIIIPQGNDNTVVTKVDIPKPMMPGRWKVKVVYDNTVMAEAAFIIIPEVYHQRLYSGVQPIDFNVDRYIQIMESRKASEDNEHYSLFTADDKFYKTSADLLTVLSKAQSHLLDWIDNLVLDSWTPIGACSVDYKTDCGAITLCSETSWSSFSPDPKSEIGAVDPRTGKIQRIT